MFGAIKDLFDRAFRRPPRKLTFSVASTTDRGLVRPDNQDSFASVPQMGFLAVADGMGGGDGGALASRWTCETVFAAWQETVSAAFPAREERLGLALREVNDRIRAYAKEKGYKLMGTTLAALLQDPEGGGCRSRIFHVGDSRIYRFRLGRLDLLTRDHTVGNELGSAMSSASADQAASLKARSNPLTHILTRAIGTELRPRPEWKTVDLQLGDRFLLCSDGVHDMLSDEEIADILKDASSPNVAMSRLEVAVRKAGAGDNYTILCGYVVAGR